MGCRNAGRARAAMKGQVEACPPKEDWVSTGRQLPLIYGVSVNLLAALPFPTRELVTFCCTLLAL